MTKLDDHPSVIQHRRSSKQAPAKVLDAAWLRRLCVDAGADDVGFVSIDRPELDDQREDILRDYPWTKGLVSIVCRMNREPIRSTARSVANLEFHHTGEQTNEVASAIVAALEAQGHRAVNPSMGFPMEMDRFPGKIWVVAHKPVAVAAGLGQMGIHRNVIHPKFGNFILLGTVLVDAEISEEASRLDFATPASKVPESSTPWRPAPLPRCRSDRRPSEYFRLLGVLHAQLPRVHGRVWRLGRKRRREP